MYLQDTLDILMHPLHWYLYCISCPHCLTKFPLLWHEEKKNILVHYYLGR